MTELKCKVCGGAIERKGNFYVCLHCRTKWVIDVADDVHAVDRANAWAALRDGDFERATELFENIILKDKNGHEAYWGRALAVNGILYVTDLSENKKVPTCNNITENSFINNSDVKKAISLAPADIAESYKSQAEYIEKVRVEWLEKASKEPEYDVFISFKDSDRDNGIERTQDSIDAQDLYNALSAEGYKVFFSRVSLRDKISEQYEPYIYNAIKTAKVMIVFGERAEYFSSVWIKNEWSRFKTRIEKGEKHKNSLVVVYKNMNPGDLPAMLSSRQCLNASDMTFFSDLNRHIKHIVDEAKKNMHLDRISIQGGQPSKKATELSGNTITTQDVGVGAEVETSISEKQSIALIHTYLSAEEWDAADKLIEEVLFDSPSCAEAIWCKILRNSKASDEQAFVSRLSSAYAHFNDFALLEKLLNCSSKDFAEHILDLFYGISFVSDELRRSVYKIILQFNYPNREKRIKEAVNGAINAAHLASFELLLGALDPNDVDGYIEYNLAFVKSSRDIPVKRKILNNVLSVDEGNLEAFRTVVDIDIVAGDDTAKIISDFETLLKYTNDNDAEVARVINFLTFENYTIIKNVIDFSRQLIRYYHGDVANLNEVLIKFAYKLLDHKFEKDAEYYLNLIVSEDKTCAEAYWGLCLMKIGAKNEADVVNRDVPIKNCAEFNKYMTLVNEERRVECIELTRQQEKNTEKKKEVIKKHIADLNEELKESKNKKAEIISKSNIIKDKKKTIYKNKKLAVTSIIIIVSLVLAIFLLINVSFWWPFHLNIPYETETYLIIAIVVLLISAAVIVFRVYRRAHDEDKELVGLGGYIVGLYFTGGIIMVFLIFSSLKKMSLTLKRLDTNIDENKKRILNEKKNIDELNSKIEKYNILLKNIEECKSIDNQINEEEKQVIEVMEVILDDSKAVKLEAPMPGVITKILVKPGAVVKAGDCIVVFEALKMEQEIKAPVDGKIATVNVFTGKKVEKGDVLVSIIPD